MEISDLIHKRQATEAHWERQSALGVELEDMDLEEIQSTVQQSSHGDRLSRFRGNHLEFLSHFGLFQNGHFTNAAVILFAKYPTRFLPQARVRVALLQHGKTGNEFIDDRILVRNLFKNISSVQAFLEKHLSTARRFKEAGWKRQDDYIFPMEALREGVMNALVHRDYFSVASSVSIIIYDEYLEITNSGKSPLKVSELKKNHLSMPVNPDIAHIAFLRGYIEKIGGGPLKF